MRIKSMTKTVKINGKEYADAELSEVAKNMVRNINIAEAKLRQLKIEASIVQTAIDSYGKNLLANLPGQETAAPQDKPVH